jgi:hypothetical protein
MVRFPVGTRDFSLLYSVQTSSGAHPTSYPMGIGGSFPEVKRLGREADHSPPSSAVVKKAGTIPPLSHTSLWCSDCLSAGTLSFYPTLKK